MHANCLGYKTAKEVPKRILCKNCTKTNHHRLVVKEDVDDEEESNEGILNQLVTEGKTHAAMQYMHDHSECGSVLYGISLYWIMFIV